MLAAALSTLSDPEVLLVAFALPAIALFLAGAAWVGERVLPWLSLFDRRVDLRHVRWWSDHADELDPDPTPPWGLCSLGYHPGTEPNEVGLPVCSDCGSLIVVAMTEMCACGEEHVSLIVGNQVVGARCAMRLSGFRVAEALA